MSREDAMVDYYQAIIDTENDHRGDGVLTCPSCGGKKNEKRSMFLSMCVECVDDWHKK